MSKKLYIFLLIINIIVISSSIYLIVKSSSLPEKLNDLFLAENISKTALQFNVENFHTQLEVWEYAYQPNDERLGAFEQHNAVLDSDIEQLINLVSKNKNALYVDGQAHAEKIISDLRQVQEDWGYLFTAIKNYVAISESGASESEIKEAKDYMDSMVFANESLFDRLQFNSEVDNFVTSQSEYTDKLRKEVIFVLDFAKVGIVFMFSLLIGGVIWSSLSFFRTKKK